MELIRRGRNWCIRSQEWPRKLEGRLPCTRGGISGSTSAPLGPPRFPGRCLELASSAPRSFGIAAFTAPNPVILCLPIKIVVGALPAFIITDLHLYSGCGHCGVVAFDELSCLKSRADFVLIAHVLVSFFHISADLLPAFRRIRDFGRNGDVATRLREGPRMPGFIRSGIDFCWKIIAEVERGVYFGWLWSCFLW